MRLFERQAELALIDGCLLGARDGRGRVALVLGSAELGKTVLSERAALLGAERGLRVLTARGGELEREMPFGIARQLFDATVRVLDPAGRRVVLGVYLKLDISSRRQLRAALCAGMRSEPPGVIPRGPRQP